MSTETDEPDPTDRDSLAEEVARYGRLRALAAQAEPSTLEVIRQALAEDDPDARWDDVVLLHYRGTREVLEAARDLCRSGDPKERSLGADILGQLGVPERTFPVEAGDILLQMLETETDTDVLHDIGTAFFHMYDPRAVEPLIRLKNHPHEDVRCGVALGLFGEEDLQAVETLIELSTDPDAEVREWATFALAVLPHHDAMTPAAHDALIARLVDEDEDVREEALLGLAELRDERVIEPLVQEMMRDSFSNRLLYATVELADPRLCAGLRRIHEWWPDPGEVDRALAACECNKGS